MYKAIWQVDWMNKIKEKKSEKKNKDKYNRWRNVTIAFRVTEEENALLNRMVKISGLTKQEYLTSNMLKRDIVVSGNPKVYKALKNEMKDIYQELSRMQSAEEISDELSEVIQMVCDVVNGMKEENYDIS